MFTQLPVASFFYALFNPGDTALPPLRGRQTLQAARFRYQQAQEQAKGALESEQAQAAAARAKQAYEQAQEQVSSRRCATAHQDRNLGAWSS